MRTPMNGIVGMAHLALQSGLDEQQRRFVKKIDDAARSLLEIVNAVLDFPKIEAGQLKIAKAEFDLYALVDRVVEMVAFRECCREAVASPPNRQHTFHRHYHYCVV